jgi:hypothetical protein
VIWPGVPFFTSPGPRDWAEAGVGQSELATPKSNRKMRATDKTGVVIVLLFMVLPASYFAQFHPMTLAYFFLTRMRHRSARLARESSLGARSRI